MEVLVDKELTKAKSGMTVKYKTARLWYTSDIIMHCGRLHANHYVGGLRPLREFMKYKEFYFIKK